MQYLHQRQLCHRDLKPENVLVRGPTGLLNLGGYNRHPHAGRCLATTFVQNPETASQFLALPPEPAQVERSTGRLRIIDFGLSKRQASAVTLG